MSRPDPNAVVISVVIPTYNRGSAIEKTIASALNQDIAPEAVEIIVIDDGSIDDTLAWLQTHYADHPRVRLFSIPNGGVANARNFGLKQARGEFIAYLDHDDLWLPPKLRLQLELMHGNPHVGVVYCHWLEVDENGNAISAGRQQPQPEWLETRSAYPWVLMPNPWYFLYNPIPSMTYPLLRTQQVHDIGGFDLAMVPSDDWDLWIRLSKITRFSIVPQVLAHYVFHPGQQHGNHEKAFQSALALNTKHAVKFSSQPYLWIKQKFFKWFCEEELAYYAAKKALVERKFFKLLPFYAWAWLKRPDKALRKRWVYLFLRAARRNSSPY